MQEGNGKCDMRSLMKAREIDSAIYEHVRASSRVSACQTESVAYDLDLSNTSIGPVTVICESDLPKSVVSRLESGSDDTSWCTSYIVASQLLSRLCFFALLNSKYSLVVVL